MTLQLGQSNRGYVTTALIAATVLLAAIATAIPGYATAAAATETSEAGASRALPNAKEIEPDLPPLQITLDSLTPIVPTVKGKLRLSGTVTNTTADNLGSIAVTLRLGQNPVSDRTQVDEIANEALDPFTRGIPNATASIPDLQAESSVPWELAIKTTELQLGSSGVYYLRIDAVADFDGSISASARSFLPWFPEPDFVTPTEVAWLWPISDWPNRDADNVFLTDRTPTELAPDGRLTRLLDIGLAAGRQPDWVVDPQVIESASVIASGYQVMGLNDPVGGGAQEPAAAWLARARAGLPRASVFAGAYADPDVTALAMEGMDDDIVAATTMAPELLSKQLSIAAPSSLGWPTGGRTDREAMDALQRAGVRTVVLDSNALSPSSDGTVSNEPTAVIRTEAGPIQAVLTDRVLSSSRALGKATDSPAEALAARQRFLAETGVLASTTGSTGLPIVVGPDRQWDPNPSTVTGVLEAMATAPWVQSKPIVEVISQSRSTTARALAPASTSGKRAVARAEHLEKVRRTEKDLRLFGSILQNPGTLTEPFAAALLRTTSGAWRSEPAEAEQLLDVVDDQLSTQIDKVRVVSGGVINVPSGSGQIPVTILNDLPQPVVVGLELTGSPTVRLVTQPFTPIVVPANRKVSTEVSAQVLGNGELEVDIQLTNDQGVSYGKPAELILRSSAYAQAASWVVGIAFLLLAGLLAMNSIRRRRARKAEEGQDGTADSASGTPGESKE